MAWAEQDSGEAPHAVVLMYHRFGEDRYPSTSIRIEQFEKQLDHLARGGFAILPLEKIVASIVNGRPLPDLAVAITIDDAYRSVHDDAWPRLKQRGWPFTVFVSTDGIDDGSPAFMSWDQMRSMRDDGVTFANHTATHDSMAERADGEEDSARLARVRRDVERAQRRLREELDRAPMLLAYPYGEYDTAAAKLVGELGYTAFGQHSGALGVGSDPRALPRFPMAEAFAGIEQFRVKVRTLPMPLLRVSPWEPLTTDRRPLLKLEFATPVPNAGELACYVSGQGRVEVEWSEPARHLSVRAGSPLPTGRNRYNCTVPAGDRSRHLWYSHPWIVIEEPNRD